MPAVAGFALGAMGLGGGLAFSAAGGAMFGGWVAGAAFGSTLLGGVAVKLLTSVALSALSVALQGKPKAAQAGIRTSTTMTGGVNPDGFILGTYATSGALVCAPLSHGNAGKTPNAYLNYIVELGGIPGQQLAGMILDGEYVDILTTSPHASYGQRIGGRFEGRAWIRYYDGSQTVADPMLLSRYPAPTVRPWTAAMVGRGICYAILTFEYDREVFHSWPQVKFVIDGIPLYDPRRDGTAGGSGAQRWDNPATWGFTDNPAVMVYNILRGIRIGAEVWGGAISADDLPFADWAAAMDVCDALVSNGSGGQMRQYRGGLEVFTEDEPFAVIENLLTACAGSLTEHGGVWKLRCGAPGMPVLFITDDDILISEPQDYEPFPAPDQIYNAIAGSYPDPDSLWESRDADPIHNPDWEAEDGGRRLTADVAFGAVWDSVQAQHLMHAMIADHRRMRVHVISLPHLGGQIEPGDVIAWTSEANSYGSKQFEVKSVTRDPRDGQVKLSLREIDPDDYNPPVGIVRPAPIDVSPVARPIRELLGFQVSAIAVLDSLGLPRRPGILLSWDWDQPDIRAVQYQIRPLGQSALVASGSLEGVEVGSHVVTGGLVAAQDYEVRARPVTDRRSGWTSWLRVTTPDVRLSLGDLGSSVTDVIAAAQERADQAADSAQDALDAADSARDYIDDEVQQAKDYADVQIGLSSQSISNQFNSKLQEEYFTIAGTNNAIANYDFNLNASFAGLKSTVGQHITAIADIKGNLTAGYLIKAQANGSVSLIDLIAADGTNKQPTSVARIAATDILLEGSVSASLLTVHDGSGNLLVNGNFREGDLRGWVNPGAGLQVVKRSANHANAAVRNSPFPYVLEAPNNGLQVQGRAATSVTVEEGDTFAVSFDIAGEGVAPVSATWQVRATFYDKSDAAIGGFQSVSGTVTNSAWTGFEGEFVAPDDAVSMNIHVVRMGGASGPSYIGDIDVRKLRTAATLITPNSVTTDMLSAPWIVGENIRASYLTIDTILEMSAVDTGFRMGKQGINDYSTDGIYMGKSASNGVAGYGFFAGRTRNGTEEYIRITENDGLTIKNPVFFTGVGGYSNHRVTASTGDIALPADAVKYIFKLTAGGGGGGGSAGRRIRDGRGQPGQAGGNTTLELWSGVPGASGSALVQSYSVTGGQGGSGVGGGDPAFNGFTGTRVQSGAPPYGSGGAGGNYRGIGYTGQGGQTNEFTFNVSSPIANPRIRIVVGAGGGGGAPAGSRGQAGSPGTAGVVDYIVQTADEVKAGVIPYAPTAQGQFSVQNGQGGSFPNLGAGMWIITTANNTDINMGLMTASFQNTIPSRGRIMTFISDRTPVYAGGSVNQTINYKHYAMR